MMNSIAREAIKSEVARRGWAYEELDSGGKYYRITDDRGRSRLGRGGRFMGSSANGVLIAIDKPLSYEILTAYGFTLPPFHRHTTMDESEEFMKKHDAVVVKPASAQKSEGVSRDVRTRARLQVAAAEAAIQTKTGDVVLQKQLSGKLYRVTLIGKKVFAAAYRRPAFVVGDGRSTVEELIEGKNASPLRASVDRAPLAPISLDDARSLLGETVGTIPTDGEEVAVGTIPDLTHGGEAADVTDDVHPELARTLVRVADVLGLEVAGFDLILDDIGTYDGRSHLPLLEINTMPGYNFHLNPTAGGVSRNPAPVVLDLVFGIN